MPWRLVLHYLRAHPLRSLLTLGSLVVAVFLICFLRSLITGLSAGVEASAANRLMVQSAVSLFVSLPEAYHGKIEQVKGVREVCKFQWFGGIYQDPKNFFAQFAVDHDKLLSAYPEVRLIDGKADDFLSKRSACLVGTRLVQRYGFKVGDKVPLKGTIFTQKDGSAWELEVAGIYASSSPNVDEMTIFFRYDYLRESLQSGRAFGPPGVGVYTVALEPRADPAAVARGIDELFAQGPQRVQTTTEAEFQRQFVTMLGSVPTFIGTIGFGVFFAILLAVLNTMLMAGRERTHDFGILKALGFTDGTVFALLLVESLALCAIGGALGVALAVAAESGVVTALGAILPTYAVTDETKALGLLTALLVGLGAGLGPALQASRLRPVEALRAEV